METKKGIPSQVFYSIEDAVQKVGFGQFQIRLTFLAGLGWLADSFEIFILSVIGDFLACEWTLFRWQTALLSSVVFTGIMVGSPILGAIADIFGRKKCLAASSVLLLVFGSLSAASPSLAWMVALRTCTGFALGGIAQAVTLCCEYCPTHMRGKTVFYMCYLWSLGSFGVILVTWLVMEYVGQWRVLLATAALPSLIVVLSLWWYPESARFLAVSGDREGALAVLERMAVANGRELPPGTLAVEHSVEKGRGRVADLLNSEHRRTSLLLWFIWWASAFAYYGSVFISPTIVQRGGLHSDADTLVNRTFFMSDMQDVVPCGRYSHQNYIDMLWMSAAEFPGLIVFTFLIEKIDRKKLLSCSCVISCICSLLLLLDVHKYAILTFLFVSRAILCSIFQLNYLITSEAYPTGVRAIAMGTGTAFCRLGGLIVPYVAQVLVVSSPSSAVCVLGFVVLAAGGAAFALPFETRGRRLE